MQKTSAVKIFPVLYSFHKKRGNDLCDCRCQSIARALAQHEPGDRIVGKLVQDGAIGALCAAAKSPASNFCEACQVIALSCSSRSRTHNSGSSLARKAKQFIDHELGLAALYLNPLQRPRQYVGFAPGRRCCR